MNATEARQIGLLMRCVDDGMDVDDIRQFVEKRAGFFAGAGKVTAKGMDLLKSLSGFGLGAAILGPPAIGATAGYGVSQLGSPSYDVEDVRHEEKMQAYRNAMAELARAKHIHPAG